MLAMLIVLVVLLSVLLAVYTFNNMAVSQKAREIFNLVIFVIICSVYGFGLAGFLLTR